MKITTKIIHNLGEYMECIHTLAQESGKVTPNILWFRGISDINHSLIPSLFRGNVRVTAEKEGGQYSALHYAEDIRVQHYIAKNHHFFDKEPSSRVEWLEVMQHQGMNTRVLDWSESSIHSLLFAMEPFLNNEKYKEQNRMKCVPGVWVLKPGLLNRNIVNKLLEKTEENELTYNLFKELTVDKNELKCMITSLQRMKSDKYNATNATAHLDYIYNLSAINDEILRDRSRLKQMLMNGDIMNSVYYVLGRIYSDGYILKDRQIPPLAVVHPYHSERIKAQKGVFTVFPFYKEHENDEKLRKLGINPDAIDNNSLARDFLVKIVINNPKDIAGELLEHGMNDSWLYPEMPIVSGEIEHHRVYY